MFTLTGVKKISCRRLSANKYQCVYIPQMDAKGDDPALWTYLFDNPFDDFPAFQDWLVRCGKPDDPLCFAIVDAQRPVREARQKVEEAQRWGRFDDMLEASERLEATKSTPLDEKPLVLMAVQW